MGQCPVQGRCEECSQRGQREQREGDYACFYLLLSALAALFVFYDFSFTFIGFGNGQIQFYVGRA